MEEIKINKRSLESLDKFNFTFFIDLYITKNFGITAYGLICFGLDLAAMYGLLKLEIL